MTTTLPPSLRRVEPPPLAGSTETSTPRQLEKEIQLPGWTGNTGVSQEITALEVDANQQGISVYASLQIDRSYLIASYDVVFRLYAKTGTFKTLIDQGRMTFDGGALQTVAARWQRLVSVGRAAADSYEITIQHLAPAFYGIVPAGQMTGRVKLSARAWTDLPQQDDLSSRVAHRVINAFTVVQGGAPGVYFPLVRDGSVFVHRFTMARTPVAIDANIAHLWDNADTNIFEPKASVYCGNAPWVDCIFPQPVEFSRGLRITFGKPAINGALGYGNGLALDASASGDDRLYVEHR